MKILWMEALLLLPTVAGLDISGDIDEFTYISGSLFTKLLPDFLFNPNNLHYLLRIEATRHYGITDAISRACSKWSIEELKAIEELAQGKPILASMLISFACVDFLDKAASSQRARNDPAVKARYEFAKRLSPLPQNLRSDSDVELFLKNYDLVHDYEVGHWFSKTKMDVGAISALHNSQQALTSGVTYQFFSHARYLMVDFRRRRIYWAMLDKIQQPDDLFGHAVIRKYMLLELNAGRRYASEKSKKDTITKLQTNILETIEKRLPKIKQDYNEQSATEFCYVVISMSREEIISNQEIINQKLQTCGNMDFRLLFKAISIKLRGDCKDFIWQENRARLLGLPFINLRCLGLCFDKEERISFFHRWSRNFPRFVLRHPEELEKCFAYFLYEFYQLLPNYLGTPLRDLLEYHQSRLIEGAKLQLEIATREGIIYINAKDYDEKDNLVANMNRSTLYYVVLSLAKQAYFRAPETFEERLLDWIDHLTKVTYGDDADSRKELESMLLLRERVNYLYPYDGRD